MNSNNGDGLKSVNSLLNQKEFQPPSKPPSNEDPTRGGIPPETFYYPVYPALAERLSLSRIELHLLCAIWALQQNTGWCYAAQTSLAYWTRISVQTLNVTLKHLEERGLLERKVVKSDWRTTQWRLGAEAEDAICYLLKQIKDRAGENKTKRR